MHKYMAGQMYFMQTLLDIFSILPIKHIWNQIKQYIFLLEEISQLIQLANYLQLRKSPIFESSNINPFYKTTI